MSMSTNVGVVISHEYTVTGILLASSMFSLVLVWNFCNYTYVSQLLWKLFKTTSSRTNLTLYKRALSESTNTPTFS